MTKGKVIVEFSFAEYENETVVSDFRQSYITASEISLLTERIRKRVFENCGVILNAVEAKASELVMLPEKK